MNEVAALESLDEIVAVAVVAWVEYGSWELASLTMTVEG